jgi:hypothetical protein
METAIERLWGRSQRPVDKYVNDITYATNHHEVKDLVLSEI